MSTMMALLHIRQLVLPMKAHDIEKLVKMILSMFMAFLTLSEVFVYATPTPGRHLSPNYYDGLCSSTGTKLFQGVTDAIVANSSFPGLAPALVRMVFHDCFVQGCDGSVLINSTLGNVAEKDGLPNINSLRGFEVIDAIKAALELICPGVFSCADIIPEAALAALRHTVQPPPFIPLPLLLGRRDGTNSEANNTITIPSPNMNYPQLVASFQAQGLDEIDLLQLSGAHTFGETHCRTISRRLYNFTGDGTGTDPALNSGYAASLKAQCPFNELTKTVNEPNKTVNLDMATPTKFDNQYYFNVEAGKVAFASDTALLSNPVGIKLNQVSTGGFLGGFAISFSKMTQIKVKLFPDGEIRSNCARRN